VSCAVPPQEGGAGNASNGDVEAVVNAVTDQIMANLKG